MLAENESRLLTPVQEISHGPWLLQLRGDEIADIEYRGRPVLRAIRVVVRDHDWRTLSPVVESVTHSRDAETLDKTLAIRFIGFGCEYRADLTVQASVDDLHVAFDGVATEDFRSNRIGLVVLHRPDDAGRDMTITSPDHTETHGAFPTDISPHQPFVDIAAMSWERDGTAFRLDFSGDVFETEDQRNWTDASFKTYSTPLSRPFPVSIHAGHQIHQSVRLSAAPSTPVTTTSVRPSAPEVLTVGKDVRGRVPALGTSASTSVIKLPSLPGLEALIVEVSGRDPAAAAELLAHASRQAVELGSPLDVRIIAATAADILPVMGLLPLANVISIGTFSSQGHVTEPELWEQLLTEASRLGFAGTLLSGARSHFTELNRRRDSIRPEADAITYSITPQMHAVEVPHIVESIAMQRQTVLHALRLGSGKPLHIGPVTLKARFNAVATHGAYDPETLEAMTTDPLQADQFTAAWLLSSINALTLPGVESISYFEASGPRGLITAEGSPTPSFEIMAKLATLRGADVLHVEGAVPGLVLYPVASGTGVLLFAANLTGQPLKTAVRLADGYTQTLEIPAWSALTRPLS
jgi:D-apionolactonase